MSNYLISTYAKLHEAPAVPGLYIWTVRPRSATDVVEASKIYAHATLSAEVRGNIRMSYSGVLNKDIRDVKFMESSELNELMSDIFFAVGYPIYIGISVNLKNRLETHKRQFEQSMLNRTQSRKSDAKSMGNRECPSDTDEESTYFGGRLAASWPSLSKDCLYVKCIVPLECRECSAATCERTCLPNVISRLRVAEHEANSLFNPVFGRR
jgi:hypothetical protein